MADANTSPRILVVDDDADRGDALIEALRRAGYEAERVETAVLEQDAEVGKLRESKSQLSMALKQSRATSVAIGVLMERLRLDRGKAFSVLRDHARSTRRRVSEVAEELLQSLERVNATTGGATQPPAAASDS
jgi:AmiR/NasT family two-component response regulator